MVVTPLLISLNHPVDEVESLVAVRDQQQGSAVARRRTRRGSARRRWRGRGARSARRAPARRVGEQRAGEDDALALAAGELAALLADERVQPVAASPRPNPRSARARSACSISSSLGVGAREAARCRGCWSRTGATPGRRARSRCADSSWRNSRRSRPPSVTRPGSGSRKRSSRLATVVLPAPLGPTSATRSPAPEPQAHAVERRHAAGPGMRARTSSSAIVERPGGERRGRRRIGDRRLAIGELEHRGVPPASVAAYRARPSAAARPPRTTPARAGRASRSARGSRRPSADAAAATASTPATVSPVTRIRAPSPIPVASGVAPRQADQRRVGGSELPRHALLRPERHELGRRRATLDELGGERTAGSGLPSPGARRQALRTAPELRRPPTSSPAARISPAAGSTAAATPTDTAPASSATSGGWMPRR